MGRGGSFCGGVSQEGSGRLRARGGSVCRLGELGLLALDWRLANRHDIYAEFPGEGSLSGGN